MTNNFLKTVKSLQDIMECIHPSKHVIPKNYFMFYFEIENCTATIKCVSVIFTSKHPHFNFQNFCWPF